jgi:hypothetical protein
LRGEDEGGDGTDPIRIYADLYHQAVECRRRVDAIRSLLERAIDALDKRPEHFRFDGLDAGRLPRFAAAAFSDAADWPTALQIQQVLADWHATGARLADAWDKLWPRDRQLLERSSPETANIPKSVGYRRSALGGQT